MMMATMSGIMIKQAQKIFSPPPRGQFASNQVKANNDICHSSLNDDFQESDMHCGQLSSEKKREEERFNSPGYHQPLQTKHNRKGERNQ